MTPHEASLWLQAVALISATALAIGCASTTAVCANPSWELILELPHAEPPATGDLVQWSNSGRISGWQDAENSPVILDARADELLFFFMPMASALLMKEHPHPLDFSLGNSVMGCGYAKIYCTETSAFPPHGKYILAAAEDHLLVVDDLSTLPVLDPTLTLSGANLQVSYIDADGVSLVVEYAIMPDLDVSD